MSYLYQLVRLELVSLFPVMYSFIWQESWNHICNCDSPSNTLSFSHSLCTSRSISLHTDTDLCGTPGYLAPETLKCNMFEGSPGYSQEVDMYVYIVIGTGIPFRVVLYPLFFHFSFQLGLWRHYVHTARGLSALLASQTNGDAAQHNGG